MRKIALLLVIISAPYLFAQISSNDTSDQKYAPVRDANAVTALQMSIAKMGNGQGVFSLVVSGTQMRDGNAAQFIWKDKFIGKFHELRRESLVNGSPRVFASGHGHPKATGVKKDTKINGHTLIASPALYCPAQVLSSALADDEWSIQLLASNDPTLIHIRTANRSDKGYEALTALDWFLDRSTYLPRAVQYHVPSVDDALRFRTASLQFADYKEVNGISFPHSITARSINGKLLKYVLSAIDINVPIADSEFEFDGGAE